MGTNELGVGNIVEGEKRQIQRRIPIGVIHQRARNSRTIFTVVNIVFKGAHRTRFAQYVMREGIVQWIFVGVDEMHHGPPIPIADKKLQKIAFAQLRTCLVSHGAKHGKSFFRIETAGFRFVIRKSGQCM